MGLAVAGCAAPTKAYRADGPRNLKVRGELVKVKGSLDVYRVAADCSADYAGTVALDRDLEIALPTGRPSYLVVRFDSRSIFSSTKPASTGALLTPKAGLRYEVAGRYRDSIYWVSLREIDRRGAHALPRRDLSECRPEKGSGPFSRSAKAEKGS